ncbi:PIG-L family deacetylase [Candidatus Sumerlaeota bacterium]|nr:PIG-L family deacetylase [Candidatus Sumerlaeota bacterium]
MVSNSLLPESLPVFDGQPFDFVAFGPHPDDIEHTIGGSIIRWSDAGKRILFCHLTSGEAGTYGSGELRQEEARAAAKACGAELLFLNFEDSNIHDTPEARRAIIAVIRAYKPGAIFAPYYHFPLMHPDHEATGEIVRAAFRMARFKGIDTGQETHWTRYLFHYLLPPDVRPSFVVDVSDVLERWLEAAHCYESQVNNIPNYYNRIMSFKKTHLAHHPAAEALEPFYCDQPLDLADLDLIRL